VSEIAQVKLMMLSASELGARMFRNNVGMGWAPAGSGSNIVRTRVAKKVTLYPGDTLVRKSRPLHAGLVKGSSDLIGWKPLIISQEMVGQPIAQFAAAEVKTKRGAMREGQQDFIDLVNLHGGRAGVVRSLDDFNDFMEADVNDFTPHG
jgi:hypothetical protein